MLPSVVSAMLVSASRGEEGLVAREEDVGEGEKPLQHVVLDDLAEVLEEEVRLLLIDVERSGPDRPDFRPSISASASTRVPRLVLIRMKPRWSVPASRD